MVDKKLAADVRSEIGRIPLIDTHEHTGRPDGLAARSTPFTDLIRGMYVVEDFLATGMAVGQWQEANHNSLAGWRLLKDRIGLVRNTAYYRALILALRDLYDSALEEINEKTWESLSERIAAAYSRPDWVKHVFRDRCNVEVVLWDKVDQQPDWPEIDRDIFLPMWRLDKLLFSYRPRVREELAAKYGVRLVTFSDCRDLIESVLDQAVSMGAPALKCNVAYQRSLDFDRGNSAHAAKTFAGSETDISARDAKIYEDHVMDLIVEGATRRGLPMQIHTGMLSGPGYLGESNPMLLAKLIKRHPKARFVLLHGGYPFTSETAILAKSFPNVYLDANWLPLISPTAMKRVFLEWLDTVPVNRIMIWGGDSFRVEGTYASLFLVKKVVSDALAERLQAGDLSEGNLLPLLWDIFRNNAVKLYRTESLRNWRSDKKDKRSVAV